MIDIPFIYQDHLDGSKLRKKLKDEYNCYSDEYIEEFIKEEFGGE